MNNPRLSNEVFSSVDAAWLQMDTPTNLAVINGVIIFDRVLDYDRLKKTIEYRILVNRRFKQRVREAENKLGLPHWETDPNFSIDNHLQPIDLPEPGDQRVLQQLVGEMMSQPLDRSQPLWQFYFVQNYGQGSALICRLHHCIADGLALIQVLLAATDDNPDTPLVEPQEKPRREASRLGRIMLPAVKAARAMEFMLHEGVETLINPSRITDAARLGKNATLALGKLLLIPPDSSTILRGRCGEYKRVAWSSEIKLEDVKSIGRMMGGTINDVLLSAVTGALRRYLEEHGEQTIGLNIRAIVPYNLRPPGDKDLTGNRFGLVFLSLPVGIQDPLKRLVTLRRRMNAIKDSLEPVVAIGILGFIGLTPKQIEDIIVTIFGMKGTAVMTNVPGPRRARYFSGGKIDSLMFWVPTPGNLGLGVSIISYDEKVLLGVATDESLIPDPEMILEAFHEELDYLKHWGRPSRRTAPKAAEEQPLSNGSQVETPPPGTETEQIRCQAKNKSGAQCKNRTMAGSTVCHVHKT